MNRLVFLGPTLAESEARAIAGARCEIRPPARRGDVYRAAKAGARIIGLVDGYFRLEAAVLHKEILWAIDRGCQVLGAASMGALRAAELRQFGMIGVGEIFEAFASGILHRDDEVAVEHGPRDVGYVRTSEPLVNMRFTMAAGVRERRMRALTASQLLAIASNMFYPNRSYEQVFAAFEKLHGIGAEERTAFDWIMDHRIDQKAADARLLLSSMKTMVAKRGRPPTGFTFEDTAQFFDFRNYADNPLTSHLA